MKPILAIRGNQVSPEEIRRLRDTNLYEVIEVAGSVDDVRLVQPMENEFLDLIEAFYSTLCGSAGFWTRSPIMEATAKLLKQYGRMPKDEQYARG